jgi:cytochrome c oxidase subunit 4
MFHLVYIASGHLANKDFQNQKSDPFTGITSPGYAGKGMVQSPPKGN